jgi:hypothetical protein
MPNADSSLTELPEATTKPQPEPQVILPAAPVAESKSVEVAEAPLAPATKFVETPASAPAVPPVAEITAPEPTTVAANVPAAEAAGLADGDESASPAVATTEKSVAVEPVVDPEEQARTLWRKAIDAEVNQDYVEAVACYEKIKKLPADVQPWGLDIRLEQAKKLAK